LSKHWLNSLVDFLLCKSLVCIFSLVGLGLVGLNCLIGFISLVGLVGLVLGYISLISLDGLIGLSALLVSSALASTA
jgi:hypothetical protein